MDVLPEAQAATRTHSPGHLQSHPSELVTPAPVKRFKINDGAKDFLAGTVGGAAGVVTGHPFDTIKVRIQCHQSDGGIVRTAMNIIRQEKVQGLFKGMASPIAGVGFVNALLFGVYGNVLRALKDNTDGTRPVPISHAGFAGSVSGIINCLASCPIELVKTRLQMQIDGGQGTHFKGPVDMTRHIYRTQGIAGLYVGMGATVWRETPSYAVYFASFEFIGQTWARRKGGIGTPDELGAVELLVTGGACGIVTWMSTYPFDVIKTRLQAQDPVSPKYKGIADCVRRSVAEEGFMVLWRGLAATVIRAFPVNGAIFAVYTFSMGYLDKYF